MSSTTASESSDSSSTRSPEPATQCTISNCPLNESCIPHARGIYKHNGADPRGLEIIFANSNPPGFIREAWQRYGELDREIKEAKKVNRKDGVGTKALKRERAEMKGVVKRFLDYHCGCDGCERCVEGGTHLAGDGSGDEGVD